MSLADEGRRGADTLTAFTFLTVAVTFLGVLTGVTLRAATLRAVSYTHLTLPTIYSV